MQTKTQLGLLALFGLLLQGCAAQVAAPPASHATIYATDQMSKAAACSATPVTVKDGADNAVAMTTGGGGWCGFAVARGGQPYAYGLLVAPAKSGRVYVHRVGDDTRIDYTPDRAPVVADSFAVRLSPGDATIQVSVNTAPKVTN